VTRKQLNPEDIFCNWCRKTHPAGTILVTKIHVMNGKNIVGSGWEIEKSDCLNTHVADVAPPKRTNEELNQMVKELFG
jgi:hypothetical protein